MSVVEAHIIREEAVSTILALVSQSSHPVAQAVAKYLRATYPAAVVQAGSAYKLSHFIQSWGRRL